MRLSTQTAVLVLLSVTVLPQPAAADPVEITSGYFTAGTLTTYAQTVMNGSGFGLKAFLEAYVSTLSLECTPCAPGTTIDLGGSFLGPQANGSAVVDGVSYPEIFLEGMTGTFSSPSFTISGTQSVTVERPFTFSGVVSGYLLDPNIYGRTDPAFTKSLVGAGTASAAFLFNGDLTPLFFGTALRYDFTNLHTTPEPATLFLVGSGAALAGLRRRKRASAPA
jgi:PEP-CTERM motif